MYGIISFRYRTMFAWRVTFEHQESPTMKLQAIRASVLAVTLIICQTAKAFDEATEKLMRLHLASYLVTAECDGRYTIDNDGFKRWADKSGYPRQILVPSVHAALMAGEDGKYNESDLIPEVTRMVGQSKSRSKKNWTATRPSSARNLARSWFLKV
jgi:hypothetical protein